ncbi:hypothetical protein AGOR_G00027030 [Albula goreensis]|uniref:Uncharacterized protein n=1 Tax=Albula goreensis TaxID=1534307 RepID=A0A8T3E620_9TELE|nr:hypothetical protein AGOR_G00027030 [Albula goreensis]
METESTTTVELAFVSAMPTAAISIQDSTRGAGSIAASLQNGIQSEDRNDQYLFEPPDLPAPVQKGVVGAWEQSKVRLIACSDELDWDTTPCPASTSVVCNPVGQALDPARSLNGSMTSQSGSPNKKSSLRLGPAVQHLGQLESGLVTDMLDFCKGVCVIPATAHFCAVTTPDLPDPAVPKPTHSNSPDMEMLQSESLWELPRIVRHKPSSIAFSDCSCPNSPPSSSGLTLFISESSDDGESSSGDEDHDEGNGNNEDDNEGNEEDNEDNDDVFTELPQYKEFLISRRRRSANRGRPKRNRPMNRQDHQHADMTISPDTDSRRSSHVESQQVLSPWSDSMTQLIRKLDQLNMDIEEALSASSSPSDTPSVTRKQMPATALGSTSEHDQEEDRVPRHLGRGECPGQNHKSSSSSSCLRRSARVSGARPRKSKGSVKMSQGGAGKIFLFIFVLPLH